MKPYETLSETDWTQVERIHDLMDEAEIEQARTAIDAMRSKRPAQADLRLLDAQLCLEEGEPLLALELLRGAERAADPAEFFAVRAAASYDLVRFEDAQRDAEQALGIRAEYGYVWDLLSRVFDHLGQSAKSAEAAETANGLDAEAFPLPLAVDDAEFDALVEKSLAEMPAPIAKHLEEFPVVVQPLPAREMLTADEPPFTPDLLGLFAGRHIFARSTTEAPSAPGAIFLFRHNLLRACTDREELAREIRITVQHEIGHLMGLDEDELDDWGLA